MAIEPDDPSYDVRTQEASALAASSAAETVILLAEMRGKLYRLLTPEQRDRLRSLRAELRAKHDSAAEQESAEAPAE